MWKYLGGAFLPGIPARDLTDEEVKEYGLAKIKKSNLYKHIKDKVVKAPAENGAKEGE